MRIHSLLREYGKDLDSIAASASDIAAVQALLDTCSVSVATINQEIEAVRSDLGNKRIEERELGDETLRLHSHFAETQSHLKALEARGGQDPYWVGAQVVLGANIPGVVGMLQSLFEAQEDIRVHLGDILGERLHAVVCEDSIAARSALEFLEASGKGRCRLLVLSSLPEAIPERSYPDAARPLLSKMSFDSRHERLIRFLLAESYALGPTVFSDHWVCGGAAPSEGEGLSLADISRLRLELDAAGARKEQLQTRRGEISSSIQEMETRVQSIGKNLTEHLGRQQAFQAQLL